MLVCRGLNSSSQTPGFTLLLPSPFAGNFGVAEFVNKQFQTAQSTYNAAFTSNFCMVTIGGQTPNGLNNDSIIYFIYCI
jgi:hypothetical protein